MLKVGITPCFMHPEVGRRYFAPKTLMYVEMEMVKFLSQRGICPVLLLDLPNDQKELALSELDGIVFSGGDDISPQMYGEQTIDSTFLNDDYRDAFDLEIFKWAFNKKTPMLGICRGAQFINVALGGSLYQDIIIQKQDSIEHKKMEIYDNHFHEVEFCKESLIQSLYGDQTSGLVNSIHHQGIKDLSTKLKVEAICPHDGVIEAFSYADPEDQFIYGVQWHPEFTSCSDSHLDSSKILDLFVQGITK